MFIFNSCSSNHGNIELEPISFPDHSFLHFPSPFDDHDSSLLLQQQQPQQYDSLLHHHLPLNNNHPPSTLVNNLGSDSTRFVMITDDQHNHQQQIQRKRASSSKRDRHSKINTLRGPRDRRMRLSLPVAREFFGLQDMLGVDKASKTVEWLLFQARHAIKKLISRDECHNNGDGDSTTRSPSLISDGEVVSGIDETTTTAAVINNYAASTKEGRKATRKDQKRGSRVARKTAGFHPMARECRAEARARARARTREKQLQIRQNSANPIEEIEGITKQDSKISSGRTGEIDEQLRRRNNHNQGIIIDDDDNPADDCLMIMGRWSPIYNSLDNNNNHGSPQEHPFGDLQFFGKPWEPYNNHGNVN